MKSMREYMSRPGFFVATVLRADADAEAMTDLGLEPRGYALHAAASPALLSQFADKAGAGALALRLTLLAAPLDTRVVVVTLEAGGHQLRAVGCLSDPRVREALAWWGAQRRLPVALTDGERFVALCCPLGAPLLAGLQGAVRAVPGEAGAPAARGLALAALALSRPEAIAAQFAPTVEEVCVARIVDGAAAPDASPSGAARAPALH